MLFKISNDTESFTVNNICDITIAQLCFPNYTVEPCNDTINHASYSKYAQSVIEKLPSKWLKKDQFVNELKKINPALVGTIDFEQDEYKKSEGIMCIYLADNTLITYEYYEDDFGDFSIGDFIDEDTW